MGLLFKADKLLQNPRPRRGLLKCSLQYIGVEKEQQVIPDQETAETYSNQEASEAIFNQEAPEAVRMFIAEYKAHIDQIKTDIELINYIIGLLIKFLDTRKSAWLMFDPVSACFIPWITMGLNGETKHKMRFPPEKINHIITTSFLFSIPGNEFDFFKQHLAAADYQSVKNIITIPLFYKDRLLSFILILNLNTEYITNKQLSTLFLNSPPVQSILGERYNKIFNIEKYNIHTMEELKEEMQGHLEYSVKNQTIFNILKLALDSTIKPVIDDDPQLSPAIIKEDVLLLLGQLFKHTGYVYNLKNGILLFVINKLRKLDLQVLKDQLLKTMKSYFAEIIIKNNFNLDFEVFSYPEAGETAADMLSVIL